MDFDPSTDQKGGRRGEAYDEDDDDQPGVSRVQCAHQWEPLKTETGRQADREADLEEGHAETLVNALNNSRLIRNNIRQDNNTCFLFSKSLQKYLFHLLMNWLYHLCLERPGILTHLPSFSWFYGFRSYWELRVRLVQSNDCIRSQTPLSKASAVSYLSVP